KRSSLLSQDRAKRQVPQGPGSGEQREPSTDDRARGQLTQEPPRYRERIGWWVEYVLKHRYEHLGEQEAEDGREDQAGEQNQHGLAAEERPDGAERRSDRGHRGELVAALGQRHGHEQPHRA